MKVNKITDLSELKALGQTDFVVGIAARSYVVSYQGKIYLFPREPYEFDRDFMSTLFGVFVDPEVQKAPEMAPQIAALKPFDEPMWPLFIVAEEHVVPVLIVPATDFDEILATREPREPDEGTKEETVTLH